MRGELEYLEETSPNRQLFHLVSTIYFPGTRHKSLSSKMLKIHKQVEDLANSARCISGLGGGLIKSAAP